MHKQFYNFSILTLVLAFFVATGIGRLTETGHRNMLQTGLVSSDGYREQNIGEDMSIFLRGQTNPGKYVGLYLLESKFGYREWNKKLEAERFWEAEQKWKEQSAWKYYLETTESIWNDVKIFPVPESTSNHDLTVSYINSWMSERTYGGKRGHEGTDIMANKNERGLYPVLSMTDGVITQKGWLPKGGYRIGIESPGGAYFYYAHLDSYANVAVGDNVKAGDILGFMGDSGYGEEGTVGQFPVHLHLGIYIYPEGREVSINSYWVLRYIENHKVKWYTEM